MSVRVVPARVWSDGRGWGLRPLEAEGADGPPPGEMHVVSLEPGAVRGNHRHPTTGEWLLVFGAPARVAWRNEAGEREELCSDGSRPLLLRIDPGVAHAVRGEGPGRTFLLSWSEGRPGTERLDEELLAPCGAGP